MGSIPTFVHWHLVHLRGYVWSDREVCKLAFKPQSPRISNLPLGYANVNNNKTKREGVDKRMREELMGRPNHMASIWG